ncbi:MAG: amidase domain-containing protein [Eubacterium sp.]
MTFGNLFLSDFVDLKTAFASELSPVPIFYRHGELVGMYRIDYSDTTTLQYKIGEDGEWTDYSVPFAVPAHQTTKVYARIGTTGRITYMNFSTTDEALGVYTESNTDFEFSYNGINFGYTRIYNSADKNWFESIHSKVLATNSRLEVTLPDNTKYPMIRKTANTYVDELNGYTLTKTDSDYIFDDGDYKYYFAINNLNTISYLSAIEDNNGNRLNLNRTTSSEEISISDGTGRSFYISDYYGIEAPDGSDANYYSVKEITDPNNNKIRYTTKHGRYISVVDQAGVTLGDYDYVSDTTDYTLTESNGNTIEYYSNGRLKKITYQNGSWIQYTYTDSEKVYTTLTSSGETTRTVYNDAFYPVEYTDELGETTTYTYDDHYRVLTEACGTETTTYTYDANGNVVSYITGDTESNTYYTYDSNKRVVREQTGDSYTYYTYDSNGNNLVYATLKEDYTGDAPALYDSSLTCFDTTTYTYDDKGRITSEVYSKGGSVAYEYDNRGNITKETTVSVDNEESTTSVVNYTYDSFGNLLTSSTGHDTSSYIYDAAGRTLLVNENGNCTRTLYDGLGRTIQEISPEDYDAEKDGLPTENSYSDANVGQRYYYNDTTGNLDREINRLDVETTYTYYDTGEKKTESFDIYKYDYNIKGNLTKVFVDDINTLTYNYDEDYNLTSEAYANGQSIHYEYDDNNNLVRQFHNDDTSPYVTYSYNEDNKLTQKINSDTGLKYVYGENNSVSVYKISDNTLVQSYTETITEADEENDIESRTDITETHFGAAYSSVIKDKSVSYTTGNNVVEYSYTENEDIIASDVVKFNGNTAISSAYEYDSNNNITSKALSYSGTVSVVNTYDDDNIITTTGYDEPLVYYTYDDNGQIVRSDNGVQRYSSTFTYDNRGNILSKNKYKYTRNENITSSPTESTTFTYSNDGWNDKLTAVNGTPLTYDANGNVLTYGDKSFTWSSGRNLSQITDGDNTYSYAYDENGIRTSKTVNGVTTYYNTKDGVILSQTDGTNTMYFQYDTSGVPIGFIWNGTQYLYMTNQMGDVISVTDAQGVELVQYEYDEWGALASIYTPHNSETENTLANINPLRYRGYYLDSETGYYYLQSRYYDPSICRFINADNYCFIDREIKNGTNLFEYSLNDPINYIDPTGNYSAKNATSYANKWWNSYNTSQYKTNSSDCANFVSQCLYAGGLSKKTTKWFANKYKITNAWGTVNGLYTWLFNQNFVKTVYTLSKKSDVEKTAKEIKTMSRCTSVIFFDKNKADGKLNHAAIIGKISYTNSNKDIAYYAHTNPHNGTFSGEGASSLKSYLDNKSGSKIVYIVVISFTFG